MEPLSSGVALVVAVIAMSGVLSWTLTVNGYIYTGGLAGLVAMTLGGMFVCIAIMPIGLVGWLAVILGAWSALHAWLGKPPY